MFDEVISGLGEGLTLDEDFPGLGEGHASCRSTKIKMKMVLKTCALFLVAMMNNTTRRVTVAKISFLPRSGFYVNPSKVFLDF